MSKNYNQLSLEQRYQIEALIKAGKLQKEIAQIVGVSPSTICRERRRNTPRAGRGALEYRARNAQRKTILRHRAKPKVVKMTDGVKRYIQERLTHERYSPELISVEGQKEFESFVSHETIYKWIWSCKHGNRRVDRPYKVLYRFLAHGRHRQKRGLRRTCRGAIPNRISIDKRPRIVEKRTRVGDIEVDFMLGRKHKGALLVMTDRATLLTRLKRIQNRDAHKTKRSILQKLKPLTSVVKTLTFDNDGAFIHHEAIGKTLRAKTYFTRPYTSQDKGTIENRIGLIRRFFPKKTDLLKVTSSEVRKVEALINNRPIRKFNYKTANQVFSEKIALIG